MSEAASIETDGPHEITDVRRWLARQLLDSKLSDREAFGVVAFHPSVMLTEGGKILPESLAGAAWGALNFILAFYEPGQRYLDTEAWKHAEAGGRRVHKALREHLDLQAADGPGPG